MALRPVMILAFVSPGSHRGTLAGELYLITHNCSHEPFFDDISSIGYRIRYVPHLGSSLFRCAHALGCTRLVVAYSCSSPIGGLASPREAGPLLVGAAWVAPTAHRANDHRDGHARPVQL